MKAGANFASSPARILIDFKDPLVVAEKIAKTDSNKFISIKDIADDLRDGEKGISGSGTMGKRAIIQKCNTNVIIDKNRQKMLENSMI